MTAITLSPLLKNKNWRYFLRDLLSSSFGAEISRGLVTQNDLVRCLVSPVTLAYGILQLAPELPAKQTLNVLIAGAETLDAWDRGAWYQALGWLLGNSTLVVNVVLVGNELGTLDGKPIPAHSLDHAFTPRTWRQAVWHKGSVKSYFAGYPNRPDFDIVFMPNPGFSAHTEWFADDTMEVLSSSGALLLATAFEDTEVPDDEWIANLFGLGREEVLVKNPFSLESWFTNVPGYEKLIERADGNDWGAIIWKISKVSPRNSQFRDQFVSAANRLHITCCELIDEFGPDSVRPFQQAMDLVGKSVSGAQFGKGLSREVQESTFITLPNSYCVDMDSGSVFNLNTNEWVPGVIVPSDVLLALPEQVTQSPFPRILWASWVFEDFLESSHVEMPVSKPKAFTEMQSLFKGSDKEDVLAALRMVMGTSREITASESPVIRALKAKDFAEAKALITRNPKLALASDETALTTLHYAAHGDNAEFAEFLLSKTEIDPDVLDGEGWTPLMYCVDENALNVIDILLDYGADIDANNPMGWTALLVALSKGKHDIAQKLIEDGADVELGSATGMKPETFIYGNPRTPQSLKDAFSAAR
jgi:hypothetical protein